MNTYLRAAARGCVLYFLLVGWCVGAEEDERLARSFANISM